ncbi:MAG: hypothetical protein AAF483_05770, partial [Planctomycetota bacterium]
FEDVDSDEIETVTVIKGDKASQAYGVTSKNGVVAKQEPFTPYFSFFCGQHVDSSTTCSIEYARGSDACS